jgi:hypothetical protein
MSMPVQVMDMGTDRYIVTFMVMETNADMNRDRKHTSRREKYLEVYQKEWKQVFLIYLLFVRSKYFEHTEANILFYRLAN